MGNTPLHVELDFKAVGELYLIASAHLLALDDELLGIAVHNVAGDVARNKGYGQTVGALHLFPHSLGVEFYHRSEALRTPCRR